MEGAEDWSIRVSIQRRQHLGDMVDLLLDIYTVTLIAYDTTGSPSVRVKSSRAQLQKLFPPLPSIGKKYRQPFRCLEELLD